MKTTDQHIVAVHLNTAGGGKRWYRSVPRSLSEAMAEHAQYQREGYASRVEKAAPRDLALIGDLRARRLKRAKLRTRQLSLFGEP